MKSFRRSPNLSEQSAYRGEVLATLEKSGLDRETTLVLGGGALALAGVRRALDIDVMVPRAVFEI